jgi:hypothetical protein
MARRMPMDNKEFLDLFWNQVDGKICLGKTQADNREIEKEWEVINHLSEINLPVSENFKQNLKNQLTQQARMLAAKNKLNQSNQKKYKQQGLMFPIWAFSIFAVLIMIFIAVFFVNQPAFASVNRSLGYGFLPEYGFFRLSNTFLLEGPLRIEDDKKFVEINQGFSQKNETTLWIKTDLDEEGLPLLIMMDFANSLQEGKIISSDGLGNYTVQFAQEFTQEDQPLLIINSEIIAKLNWIKSQSAGLAPTMVMVSNSSYDFEEDDIYPCSIVQEKIKICVEAVFRDQQGMHVQLLIKSGQNNDEIFWVESSLSQTKITDEFQRSYQAVIEKCDLEGCHQVTLLFKDVSTLTDIYQLRFNGVQIQQKSEKIDLSNIDVIEIKLPKSIPNFEPTPRIYPTAAPDFLPVPAPDN